MSVNHNASAMESISGLLKGEFPDNDDDKDIQFEAYARLQTNGEEPGIPMVDVMAHYGITQDELDEMEDVAIE